MTKLTTTRIFALLLALCVIAGGVQASCTTCTPGGLAEVRVEASESSNCCGSEDFTTDWQQTEGCACCEQNKCDDMDGVETKALTSRNISSSVLFVVSLAPSGLLEPEGRPTFGLQAETTDSSDPTKVYLRNASFLC